MLDEVWASAVKGRMPALHLSRKNLNVQRNSGRRQVEARSR